MLSQRMDIETLVYRIDQLASPYQLAHRQSLGLIVFVSVKKIIGMPLPEAPPHDADIDGHAVSDLGIWIRQETLNDFVSIFIKSLVRRSAGYFSQSVGLWWCHICSEVIGILYLLIIARARYYHLLTHSFPH